MKDYYKVLGINKNCSKEELNKVYRELVLKYHPDRNIDKAEEYSIKFKEIQEAYEFVSKNPTKFQFKKNDIDDIFDNVFSKFFNDQNDNSSKIRLKISLEESYYGCFKEIEIDKHANCENCNGSGGSIWEKCEKCNNGRIENTSCIYCLGKGSNIKVKCSECHGKGYLVKDKEKVIIEVPAGIEDNTQIRLSNKGSDDGDLYVIINVQKNNKLTRQNQNIIGDLEVPYGKLVLGGEVDYKLFDNVIKIKIKPKTKSGSKIIIDNYGFGSLVNNSKGNLILNVQVKLPEKITKELKDTLEKLSNFDKM